jgi:polyhydroxyalkanoate synthase
VSPDPSRPVLPVEWALTAQRLTLGTAADAVRATSVLPDRLGEAATVGVGETESEVVYTENKLRLRRYASLTDSQHDVPILIVYALINRPYVLDLQPDRSVVRRLLAAGHDVYLLDWGEPSLLDAALSLDDYVTRYLDRCVDVVRDRAGCEAVSLLGYCMGGTLSAAYAALVPEKVAALGLMAAPLAVDDTGGILEHWGDEAWYDPWAVADAFGTVPAEFLAAGFDLMDPVSNAVGKYARLADNVENQDFVENFARMERWLGDGVDVAGTAYAEFVEAVYQENRLARGELVVGGDRVDPGAVEAPVLLILGAYDRLVPPAASRPFADLVGTDDVTTVEYPTGHVGLAMSARAHHDLWPEVAEWFLDQTGRPSLADVLGEGVERALGVDVETDVTVGDVDEVEVGVADDGGQVARAVVGRDAGAIARFLADALDVRIALDADPAGVVVVVETPERTVRTPIESVGEAIRAEVAEAVADRDAAATHDLEDVEGIGPTYAGRLREAGVDSVAALAAAEPDRVADAARSNSKLARAWVDRAQALAGSDADEEAG